MSEQNKLFIAAAGSGKTTLLVRSALKNFNGRNILITTYTEANEAEIKNKILQENSGEFPKNIKVQTWFSFLLQHGVRPYQGTCNDMLFDEDIKGVHLSTMQSGCKKPNTPGKKYYWGENDFKKYYFTSDNKVHSDKLSKLVVRCNEKTKGQLIFRLSKIYPVILIDEVQDLAGYDLTILQLLFQSSIIVLLAGDPRQVTYLTHHERKYSKYRDGKIKEFILDECKNMNIEIDELTLRYSHRNNAEICSFSSKLYKQYMKSEPCICSKCRAFSTDHKGIYLVRKKDLETYKQQYNPTILKYQDSKFPEWNFGKSKGLGFDRVLIYPTKPIEKYLKDEKLAKIENGETKDAFDIAKFYVALTRARYSVGIVYEYKDNDVFIEGVQKYIAG